MEDQVAALVKRLDGLEKKQKKQRKELEQAHARIDFLTRVINQGYPFQSTAPVAKCDRCALVFVFFALLKSLLA